MASQPSCASDQRCLRLGGAPTARSDELLVDPLVLKLMVRHGCEAFITPLA